MVKEMRRESKWHTRKYVTQKAVMEELGNNTNKKDVHKENK